jgi:16S rRNA C967 or C1407 C5-methylase (RsmB/RsmF family)
VSLGGNHSIMWHGECGPKHFHPLKRGKMDDHGISGCPMPSKPANPTGSTSQDIMKEEKKAGLAPALKEFYEKNNIDVSDLLGDNDSDDNDSKSPFSHRFIRLNPRYDRSETLLTLNDELKGNIQPIPVPWMDESWGFYALPGDFSIASSPCFRSGRMYGMDISSGAGVATLLSENYDKEPSTSTSSQAKENLRILDLCCCPGLKLCAMADVVANTNSTVIGVDVSENRMALCKKIVQKYQMDPETSGAPSSSNVEIRMYCQDGTMFGMDKYENNMNLVFDSQVAAEEYQQRGKRKRMNKSARARERKRLKEAALTDRISTTGSAETCSTEDEQAELVPVIKRFDRVLVDAECSTDGSLKHVEKKLRESTEATNLLLTDGTQLAGLVDLQKRLIASGFRLLKPGGTLVYSTCSLSVDQNENVVKWLLQQSKDAFLIPVHFPLAKSKLVAEGSVQGTVRFLPNLAKDSSSLFGGGFFLAKFGKKDAVKTR